MSEPLDRIKAALPDRYAIEREIGSGGMATVYLAEDLKHHRKVALKVLRPELTAILGAQRFLREIELTAGLQHPHILPLYDSGQAGPHLFYVMPYVEGESLRERLDREGQLPVEEALEIARSVAAALEYAHERGVVHRDIKPANILLQGGQAVVADFGIAVAVSAAGGTRLTETGLSLGTPSYMSPEQATGDRQLDARSDVYSLGAVLYEMLVGEPPHVGRSAQAIVARILSETVAPISRTRELIPPNVDAAVQRALARSPADRFRSAADFSSALADPGFTLPTLPATAAVPAGVRRWRRVGIGAATVALLASGLAVRAWVRSDSSEPVTRSFLGLPSPGSFVPTWGQSVALSPDGATLAYIGPSEEGTAVWVKERSALEARPLRGTEGASQVLFDPSGRNLAFLVPLLPRPTAGESIRRIPLAGGTPVTLVDAPRGRWGMVSWGDDGYLYAGQGRVLTRIPEVPGAPTEPLLRYQDLHTLLLNPQTLPGSRGLLFTLAPQADMYDGAEIAVLDFRTGEHRVLARGAAAWYTPSGHLLVLRAEGTLLAAPFDVESLSLKGPLVPVLDNVAFSPSNVDLENGAFDLTFSADGTLVYMPAGYVNLDFRREVVWVSRTGAATPLDSTWRFDNPDDLGLALSPDGNRLAIELPTDLGDDIWIKHLPDGPLTRLTFTPGQERHPRWTRDGRSVLYLSCSTGDARKCTVFSSQADGVGSPQPVLTRAEWVCCVSVSPASDWLLIRATTAAGSRDVFARRPGIDSVDVPLLTEEYDETAPAISPDGKWLAYQSYESGRWEVFVRPFPNVDDGKWQVSVHGGLTPLWAHSGRELFYLTPDHKMMAVAVKPGPTFTMGATQVLFKLGPEYAPTDADLVTAYDISPDDQRFIMLRAAGDRSTQPHLVMVENWFQELRDKVGR